MKRSLLFYGFFICILIIPGLTKAQDFISNAEVSGNFQADGQYYMPDKDMGITDSTINGRHTAMNAFTQINYGYKNFSAGLRFEAYLPPLTGYDVRNDGSGVPYWFVNYKNDKLDITAGNFYEQFGNGLTLRTWQEWTLGYDNSLRGVRVKFAPIKGIAIKGVWGYQRNYWEPYKDNNRGIVKGGDVDIYLNDLFKSLEDAKTKLTFGGSVVTNYQEGKTVTIPIDTSIYVFKLPENVTTFGARVNLNISGFNFFTEYAHKINDPSAANNFIYKTGNGLYSSVSYSQKGLGLNAQAKISDNMSFKSDRFVTTNQLNINYLPSITKEHSYALASMYPYATQAAGEVGFSGTATYTMARGSVLGGKSGMTLAINYSQVKSLKKDVLNDSTAVGRAGTEGYSTPFFALGRELYYSDLNIEVDKKFSKKWKSIFTYLNQAYNKDVVEGHVNEYGIVYSNIGIADITWNITKIHSLRGEFQGLWTKQDKGNWAAILLEYTVAPNWFFSVQDQYNYGNKEKSQQLHYYLVSGGYTHNTSRIAVSYGRQREGILCVGGVCRYVPAASGVTLTITSSF